MIKKVFFTLLALVSSLTLTANAQYSEGAMFYYKSGNDLLYISYKNNRASLEWLNSMVIANRAAIQSGKAYFEIFSYIPASLVGNEQAINEASIEGSVVRAYLKTEYGIQHSQVVFGIDTTQGLKNVVQLQLVSGSISPYANQQISYSLDRSSAPVSRAIARYTYGVPYTSYIMHIAKRDYKYLGDGSLYTLKGGMWTPEDFARYIEQADLSEAADYSGMTLYIKDSTGRYIPATSAEINSGNYVLYYKDSSGTYATATRNIIVAEAKRVNASLASPSYLSDRANYDGYLNIGPTQDEGELQQSGSGGSTAMNSDTDADSGSEVVRYQYRDVDDDNNNDTSATTTTTTTTTTTEYDDSGNDGASIRDGIGESTTTTTTTTATTTDDQYTDNDKSSASTLDDSRNATAEESLSDTKSTSSAKEERERKRRARVKKRTTPVFALKTNMLYWATALPNLEMEFYMGKGISLALEGNYTWLTALLNDRRAYYVWNAGAELRFWFKANKKFEGFYMGIGGSTGQYDFKFSTNGNQGDYYTAALSFGYVLPVSNNFNIEFGIAGGYVNYTNQEYKWNDVDKYVPTDPIDPIKQKWKIFPTKAKVSLVWKF